MPKLPAAAPPFSLAGPEAAYLALAGLAVVGVIILVDWLILRAKRQR